MAWLFGGVCAAFVSMRKRNGFVISDLHLFAKRSDGQDLFDSVRAKIAAVDVLVLNGDTFDFRWSQLAGEEETIAEAIRWLTALIGGLRVDQRLYVLHGNHDCHAGFAHALDELSATEPRLVVEPRHLILGRNMFLHGDGANWRMDRAGLDRFRDQWSRDRARGNIAARVYGFTDAIGVSKVFHRFYFPTGKTIQRIAFHLDEVQPDWRGEVESVFFGHTHCPFEGIEKDCIRFSNTGSGIRGMGFAPLDFEFESVD